MLNKFFLYSFIIFYTTTLLCFSFKEVKCEDKSETNKKVLIVYVVRHAEAYQNLKNKNEFPKEKQDTLTDTGIKQATTSADSLKLKNISAIYYSPTGRTKETAEIIAKSIGGEVSVEKNDNLKAVQDGKITNGETSTWKWREEELKNGKDTKPDGGESMQDGQNRIITFINSLKANKPSGQSIVIVTHSDICAVAIGNAKKTIITDCYKNHKVEPGAVTKITISGDTWTIE